MRWVIRTATLSLSLAAGCVGGYQPGTPGTPGDPGSQGSQGTPGTPGTPGSSGLSARELFDMNVLPMLGACASCHAGTATNGGPKFLGVNGDAYYASLVADVRFVNNVPESSYLITHQHAVGEGPDLNATQDKNVVAWIAQENVEQALPPPPAPANVGAQQLAAFGKCMTQADFNSSGMNDLQNQGTNGNGGTCTSCHQTGQYVFLSASPTGNFTRLQQSPYIMKFALPTLNTDGTFKDIAPALRFKDRGTEPGHPQYTLTTNRVNALNNFFQLTYTKWKAGNCPAPAGP